MIEKDKYEYSIDSTSQIFHFESVGNKGIIHKCARFTYKEEDIYNFGFGDWDISTNQIRDDRMSRNNDAEKVLNTVAHIIQKFTTIHWDTSIYIKGNTPVKHRWYQMSINKNHDMIDNFFDLWGLRNGNWETYEVGTQYEAFLGRRKTSFLLL